MDQMTGGAETIYVAVGKAVEESKHTLLWALQNLCPAKVCILHVQQPASVITSSKFNGRISLTASRLEQHEVGKTILDRIMNDYLLICRQKKVQAAKLNIEMDDAAKGIVELIRDHNIKKLVMGAAADKHFSEGMTDLKSEKAEYVKLHAPPSCQIWFICGGQIVLRRSFVETGKSNLSSPSSSSSYLRSSSKVAIGSETSRESPEWLEFHEGSSNDQPFDKLEQALLIAEKSNQEALEELDRRVKAEKNALSAVIGLASEMKSSYTGELKRRREIEAELIKQNGELEQIKQQRSDEARKLARAQKSVLDSRCANSDHIKELEAKLSSAREQLVICQRERDELQKKLENTCKPIEEHLTNQEEETSSVQMQQFFSEYSVPEIHDATEDFDPSFKIAEGAYGRIYKCILRHTEVAIKVLHQNSLQGPLEFQQEVDILSKLRHPNLVTLIGVCPEIWALIYEYLPNGSLEDRLSHKNNTPPLSWQTRIHIATEICSALIFLHSSKPLRLVHGNLKPGNILLGTNFGCKLSDFGVCHALSSLENSSNMTNTSSRFPYVDPQFRTTRTLTPSSDIYSFGIILLQLITGKPPLGLTENVQNAINGEYLNDLLDPSAGGWSYLQAAQLTRLALRCCDTNRSRRPDLSSEVYEVLEQMRNSIGPLSTFHAGSEEHRQPPHYFICPISMEVMTNPHVAADGFTYELRELRTWLDSGHNTSPTTNAQLAHRNLIPNHALRSAILEWRQQQQRH